jgi:hypothetical protein
MVALYARWLTSNHHLSNPVVNDAMGYCLNALLMKETGDDDGTGNDCGDDDEEEDDGGGGKGKTSLFAADAIRNLCSRASEQFSSPDILNEIIAAFENATNTVSNILCF